MKITYLVIVFLVFLQNVSFSIEKNGVVFSSSEIKVTILSTMISSLKGHGEWGFSSLVETENEAILFDTGFERSMVLNSAKQLKKDISKIEKVVLSHFHSDHTGGLLNLRKQFMGKNPKAFQKVYIGKDFFRQRYTSDGKKVWSIGSLVNLKDYTDVFNNPNDFKKAAETLGIEFIVVEKVKEISPGIFITGAYPKSS